MLSACWLISAYFLAVSSHKRGCLNTSVYGSYVFLHAGACMQIQESMKGEGGGGRGIVRIYLGGLRTCHERASDAI